jgi:hypothetical protein
MAGVENVHLGALYVLPIMIRLADIERGVMLAPDHQHPVECCRLPRFPLRKSVGAGRLSRRAGERLHRWGGHRWARLPHGAFSAGTPAAWQMTEGVCSLGAGRPRSFGLLTSVHNHEEGSRVLIEIRIVVRHGFETPGCACSGGQG